MGHSLNTPVGRASFPHLDKPDNFNKYSLKLLLPKSDPKVQAFMTELKNIVQKEMLAICGEKGMASGWANFTALKDGDNVSAYKTYRAESAGHWELSLSKKPEYGKPCVVNRNKQPIDATEVYSGCNILCHIDVYGYNFNGKKSVALGLQHVMKTGDNTPFASTGQPVESAFAGLDIPEEDMQVDTPVSFGAPAQTVAQPTAQPVGGVSPFGAAITHQPAANPFSGV